MVKENSFACVNHKHNLLLEVNTWLKREEDIRSGVVSI